MLNAFESKLIDTFGAAPYPDPTLWAGVAIKLIDATDDPPKGLVTYVAGLPDGLAQAIRAAEGWAWAPCTRCGAGKLVVEPPKPRTRRAIGTNDGPACYMVVINERGETDHCRGHHYPLDGYLQHPLAIPELELPW